MQEFKSVNDILDFAISEEEAAAKFYRSLAQKMDRAWMRQVFEDFAAVCHEFIITTQPTRVRSGDKLAVHPPCRCEDGIP